MSKILDDLNELVEALEAKGYPTSPPTLQPGPPLKIEDISIPSKKTIRIYLQPDKNKSDLETWYAISK